MSFDCVLCMTPSAVARINSFLGAGVGEAKEAMKQEIKDKRVAIWKIFRTSQSYAWSRNQTLWPLRGNAPPFAPSGYTIDYRVSEVNGS